MKHRLMIPLMIATLALGSAAACGGNPEPEGPTPAELAAQRRADSLEAARAEQARLDAERRAEQDRLAAERAARDAAARETEAARSILQEMINFDYDRAAIRSDAEQRLMRKLAVLRANPNVRLRIAGHADERGSVEYNLALAQRRADAARDFLVGFGIPASRLETVSFGEDRPLVRASNEQAWAQNRRDEFTVIAGGDTLRNPGGN
ncbi:MAG TPA: OmpA family protein [Longimicrobiales bacterium]|nr:OmpA family protein [Longimicrobiales bacterium]